MSGIYERSSQNSPNKNLKSKKYIQKAELQQYCS